MRGSQVVQGDPDDPGRWQTAVDGCDAVVNLAGHNLFAERWNAEVKRKIRDSRVYGDRARRRRDQAGPQTGPQVLVQASAIGYYGPHGDEELTEASPSGSDFMAVVCREWEEALRAGRGARASGVAVVRTGVVLAPGEGALGVMTPIFKWLPGRAPRSAAAAGSGPASGQQWMSWIHIDDIVGHLPARPRQRRGPRPDQRDGAPPGPERRVLEGPLRASSGNPTPPGGSSSRSARPTRCSS